VKLTIDLPECVWIWSFAFKGSLKIWGLPPIGDIGGGNAALEKKERRKVPPRIAEHRKEAGHHKFQSAQQA
jgi:hypothetical protein